MTGTQLEGGSPLLHLLRSGELLCDLLNALRPGIVPKISRHTEMASLHESKRNARMRENIGQYVDGCAELGLPQRDLFMTADLFDGKDDRAVMRHLESLARFAQEGVAGFKGPFVGKRVKKAAGGGGARSTLPGCYSAIAQPRVILGGGAGFQSAVGGRGM